MRLLIHINLQKPLELPINYHHIFQGVIYKGLSNHKGYSTFVHNEGYHYEKRQFKMFTFSNLEGKYFIRNKRIRFEDEVKWEIRSPEILFIQTLATSFGQEGISFLGDTYKDLTVKLLDDEIEEDDIIVRMKMPICLYSTEPETKKMYFYRPDEILFYQLLADNFERKYQACYGVKPEEAIEVLPVEVCERDKYVTRYKNCYISGWRGTYRIKGKRKYLNFLYATGLGSKNSQGFGMFEVI